MKKLVMMVGLLSLLFATSLMAQPTHRIHRLRTGIRVFCKMHPNRASCQQWIKARKVLARAAKGVRQDIKAFCQKRPHDKYCQRLEKVREWRRQHRQKRHTSPSNKTKNSQTK